jgi:hypothetical protein
VVPERVVDLLEVVEVHQHHAAARAGPARGPDRLLDAVAEQDAVGQPGERVVDGLVLLGDRGAPAAVDREQRQEQQRHERQRVVGGEHDDRREPEHQSRRRRLREPVVDEVAPDPASLDQRQHGGHERRVDEEERQRRGHDRGDVAGREVELARARDVGQQAEHEPGRGHRQRVLRHVVGDLVRRLAPQQVRHEVRQQQPGERRLDAAGDQQRDRKRRRRGRLSLRAAGVDAQRHELAEQRAQREDDQLVLAEAREAVGSEGQHGAARDRPEDGHRGDVLVEPDALLHHFRACSAVTAG